MPENTLVVTTPNKGGVIFDTSKPNHPRPRHEQIKQVYNRLLELGVLKPRTVAVLTEKVEVVNEISTCEIPGCALSKDHGENLLWDSIRGENFFSPNEGIYSSNGVEYKDVVSDPIMIKGFGGLKMAIPSEVINGKTFYCAFFVDGNKKPWKFKTINGAVQCNRTILKKVYKGRDLSDENERLFKEAAVAGKIVSMSNK